MRLISENQAEYAVEDSDIFKYGAFRYLEKTLENATVKFSRLVDYNDPFETAFAHRHYAENIMEIVRDRMITPTAKAVQPAKDEVGKLLDAVMVSCFSARADEPLMWAHYADNHTGVCYCFDKAQVFRKQDQLTRRAIRYATELPPLDSFTGVSTPHTLRPQIIDIITTKSIHWSYEAEYRYFGVSNESSVTFEPSSLKAVIMGLRTTPDDHKKALGLLARYQEIHGTKPLLIHTACSRTAYRILLREKPGMLGENTYLANFREQPPIC